MERNPLTLLLGVVILSMTKFATLVVSIGLVFSSGCVRHKPITNDDLRSFASVGTPRVDVERALQTNGAQFLYRTKSEIESEMRVPEIVWESPDSVGIYLGHIKDVRTLYYMLASEHISFEIEVGPAGLVTASRVFNSYTAP
jgi:hypothetical protein